MTEPANTTAAGVAIATGAITLTGSVFGLQFDALLFGLFGGLISLMHLPAMGLLRLIGTLGSASLLGGLFGPAGVAAAASYWAWVAAVPPIPARLGSALFVGLFAQALIPLVLTRLERKSAQSGGAS